VSGVLQKFGRIDILINAAGGYSGGSLAEDSQVSEFEAMLKLNFFSALHTIRAILPMMKRQHYGRIVNIAAMPALYPKPRTSAYAVSKKAVIGLTESIAEEVKGSGIIVNAIAPSIILTDPNQKAMPEADFSKWVKPAEIASLVMFLCSEETNSVNGNVIKIFGGL
jgi:NAD(P)-dependent dehydrogenase (short-subunit alcohol dehydrogenase family)